VTFLRKRPFLIAFAACLFALTACDSAPSASIISPPTSTTAPSAALRPASPTPRPPTAAAAPSSGGVTAIPVGQGLGFRRGFWEVYFTAPTGSRDPATYVGGIDEILAARIDGVRRTLDIAAFEFNSPALTQAVIRARQRGVRVRMVTDSEHGLNGSSSTIPQLIAAGINIVDDARSALMHNKFMILDGQVVWTGSWNYTINDTYRNNNNAIALRSQQAVANYQAEFDEMFVEGLFGSRSPAQTPNPFFVQDGVGIATFFAPEDDVISAIETTLVGAQQTIDFMAFSFTLDDMASIIINRGGAGVRVRGIFERTGSETQFSELRPLRCAGLDARQDGNPFVLHHKVFIVDGQFVLTGSFNFSASATRSNDENLLIINDPDLARLYAQEFERRWAESRVPTLTC
jgi:phosphatidylserine/phosphatidylglycerophosphate/cardiolipin synthase-like enzyme